MIELEHDGLAFSFPGVHKEARLSIDFQRTLRIPDDGSDYPLPAGLGRFPLRHVDDFAKNVPPQWIRQGGVMLPMYQSEALWLNFHASHVLGHAAAYPFAIKVAAGKINAVTGKQWTNELHRGPQDYMVVPGQPWLDGFCVQKGVIRQFVAMPLGSAYSAEEQITGKGEFGGLQIIAYPMKREVFERRFPKGEGPRIGAAGGVPIRMMKAYTCAADMGLAPGGRMKQEIYGDRFDFEDWDTEHSSRCFVHIANSLVWRAITGQQPPTVPPTSKEYTAAGLPWFQYYDDSAAALDGASILQKLKSVMHLAKEKRDVPLPENEPVVVDEIVRLRKELSKDQVREGEWV